MQNLHEVVRKKSKISKRYLAVKTSYFRLDTILSEFLHLFTCGSTNTGRSPPTYQVWFQCQGYRGRRESQGLCPLGAKHLGGGKRLKTLILWFQKMIDAMKKIKQGDTVESLRGWGTSLIPWWFQRIFIEFHSKTFCVHLIHFVNILSSALQNADPCPSGADIPGEAGWQRQTTNSKDNK